MAIFVDAQTDAADLAGLVNENGLFTTRYGDNPKKSWLYMQDEFDTLLTGFTTDGNDAIDDLNVFIDAAKIDISNDVTEVDNVKTSAIASIDNYLSAFDAYYQSAKDSLDNDVAAFTIDSDAALADFAQNSADAFNEFDLTLDQYKESRGFNNKGTFAAGFTYELPNDVGIDGSGNPWIYNGTLPFTVIAGATPANPTYTQVTYSAAAQVSMNTSDTVQSFADSFALKIFQSPTSGSLTEIQTRTANANEVYEVRKTSDDSLATIYSDAAGPTEIVQNGIDNVSGSDGTVEFYIGYGDYYVLVGSEKTNFTTSKKPTSTASVLDIESGAFDVGEIVEIPSRNFAKFTVESGGAANGMDIIDAGSGNTANLIIDNETTVDSFGASSLSADNHPAIQRMVDLLGYFTLNGATYTIQDEILFNGSANNYGSKWSGQGKEKSFLSCVNMAGKSAIRYVTGSLCRVTFQDFKIDGDCDTCLDFPDTTLVYQSSFERLWLNSSLGTCFKILRPFSTTVRNVEVGSAAGHSFESYGGNTFKLDSVYAHKVGEGFAGFRIYGKATLDNCNGIDELAGTKYWGWFGNSSTGNSYNISMRNCNLEDFGEDGAIKTEHFGSLSIYASSFLPRATGTYDNIIQMASSGNNKLYIDLNTTVASKGATLSGESNVKVGDLKSALSLSPNFVDFSIGSTVYDMPNLGMIYPAFQQTALSTQGFYAKTDYSFVRPKIKTIANGATTTTTDGNSTLQTANGSATTLQTITDVQDGAKITILIKDNNTTIAHNTGGTGRFILKAGVSTAYSSADILNLTCNSGRWVES